MNSQKRIIIVNPFGIGDVLFSTPAIESLREAYPDAFIGYLCNARTAPILESNPGINKVFIYEKDDWRKLWRESKFKCIGKFINFLWQIKNYHFDLSIDLSLGRHYSFFLWLLGIKSRYGFNYRNRGIFLTGKINIDGYKGKHVIEHHLDLLRFMGLSPTQVESKAFLDKKIKIWAENFLKSKGIGRKKYLLGVVPGGGVSWGKSVGIRRWSKEKFAQLMDNLIEKYPVDIVVFGDMLELELSNKIISLMRKKPFKIVGETELMQLAALLSKCDLVIANDGGPLHLAVAVGVKTVSLFGPVDDKVYGQYPVEADMHRIITRDLACRPCYDNFRMSPCQHNKECLDSIEVADVLDAVSGLLKLKSKAETVT